MAAAQFLLPSSLKEQLYKNNEATKRQNMRKILVQPAEWKNFKKYSVNCEKYVIRREKKLKLAPKLRAG